MIEEVPFRRGAIDAESIVAQLRDLRDGPAAALQAIRLGANIVPALESLLRGRSESVFQPRCLAADALAAIGGPSAREVLVRALEDSTDRDLPPVLRFAEDAVANRIAEHLGAHPDPAVADALLAALTRRPLAGCARSLGQLRESRAVPLFAGCLYDDFARDAARDALVELGEASTFELSRVLLEPRDECGLEGSNDVAARVAAAEALGGIGGSQAEYALLRAQQDPQRAVRIAAALSICARKSENSVSALPVILGALGSTEASLRMRVSQCLLGLGAAAEEGLIAAAGSCGDRNGDPRRLHAVEILKETRSSGAIDVLAGLALDAEARVRFAAASALAKIAGADTTVSLIGFVDDAEPSVRMVAVSALGERDVAAAPALARALGDPERAIRRRSSQGLLRMGAAAAPALREAIERTRGGGLLRRWRVRRLAKRVLRTAAARVI